MKNLKKLVFVTALFCLSIGAFAQKGGVSLVGQLGYQSDAERFGVQVQGRYGLTNEIRLAPSLGFMFPKHRTLGLEVDLNLQYAFPIAGTSLDIYPTTGLNMSNNRRSPKVGDSVGFTKWGYNIGAGFDYHFTSSDFLNFEFQYTFGSDCARIMVGYGYKF